MVALSFTHLSYIDHSRYILFYELIKRRVGDVCSGFHPENDGNVFVGGFVKNDLILSPNMCLHVDLLNATVGTKFDDHYKYKYSSCSATDKRRSFLFL